MSASNTTPPNWSIQAIPTAFALGIVPHLYYQAGLLAATKGQMSIAQPRTNLDAWKSQLPARAWNHLARARGAHINGMEVFPLFAAAMVAGNVAKLPSQDLNHAAWTFLAARTIYTAAYIAIGNDKLAYARTGLYAWSISIPMLVLWRAGNAGAV